MTHISLKYEEAQADGSVNKTFAVEWIDLEAEFTINEDEKGWEVIDVRTIRGDATEVQEVVDEYMNNEYVFEK